MCDLRYTPSTVPSASTIAIELKWVCPARSKNEIGSTTPSSAASAAKRAITG